MLNVGDKVLPCTLDSLKGVINIRGTLKHVPWDPDDAWVVELTYEPGDLYILPSGLCFIKDRKDD